MTIPGDLISSHPLRRRPCFTGLNLLVRFRASTPFFSDAKGVDAAPNLTVSDMPGHARLNWGPRCGAIDDAA
jgi:hypothetical protein